MYDVGLDGIKGTADDGGVKYVWALDTITQPGDGLYDHDAQALATGEIPNLTGADGTNYGTINNNLGSGKADFIGYVPTMDLSKFNRNWLFVTEFNLGGLNDGYEEIFLTGAIAPQQEIPEPSSIVLLGAGLLGVLSLGRRKNRK